MTTPYLSDRRPPGPLGKALALLGGAALLVLGFLFSLVLLAIAAVLLAGVSAYLWWKTRELRRQLREASAACPEPNGGSVIDGEATHVADDDSTPDRR